VQTPALMKRRHLKDVADTEKEELSVAFRRQNKPRFTNTQRLRTLRTRVASLEQELHGLQSKWNRALPDELLLAAAHHCASEKRAANRTDKANRKLMDLLQQHQFLFATLQAATLHSPLWSNGDDLFKALHFGTQLGREAEEREHKLRLHNERSLATLPSIVKRFSQMAIDKALAKREGDAVDKPVLPLSQINVTGCKDCTLVSSIFISEIPHSSLEEVYAAVLAYFDSVPRVMKRHFGVDAKHKRLNGAASPVHYQRSEFSGAGAFWTENNVVSSELTSTHGMVHIDAVTDDPLYPVITAASSRYGICGLTVSPRRDPVTDATLSVTLRWAIVYRYKMLPHDPAIREDLETIRPLLNGDVITASVCSYIHELQRGQRRIRHRKTWTLEQEHADVSMQ
jgi:hypothetical protein